MKLIKSGSSHILVWSLAIVQAATSAMAAESHVVPLTELHQQAASAGESRQANLAQAREFFALAPVQDALHSARIDGARLDRAIPLLSDDELARLAARAAKAQADLRAGSLTNQELTYIVIALGTAVLILVIVAR